MATKRKAKKPAKALTVDAALAGGLGDKIALTLAKAGIRTARDLRGSTFEEILAVDGLDREEAAAVLTMQRSLAGGTVQPENKPKGADAIAISERREPKDTAKDRPLTVVQFIVNLQPRHAEWVRNSAKLHKTTSEHVIEQCVRRYYASDPYKAGKHAEGGGTMPAADNRFAKNRGSADDE